MKIKKSLAALLSSAVLPMSAWAGVVFQVETTYHSGSPGVESSELSVEKPNLKMEIAAGSGGTAGAERDVAIFNGDRREMIVVDSRDQSYMVIDSETTAQLSASVSDQMSQAMREMESQLEGLDPMQREMVERMLKGKMDGAAGPVGPMSQPPTRFLNTGQRGTKEGYPCVRYDVLRGEEKVQELWVTDWSNIEGGTDVAETFGEMAEFVDDTMGAFSQNGGLFEASDNPIEAFTKINGFPVVTRDFEGGELESETVLKSVTERDLDPDAFEPPKGYRLRTMGPQ